MAKKALVLSVEKALKIIDLFRHEKRMNLTEISGILNLPKSTAFGLIATLEKYGYLEQELDTGKYQLGITFLEMGGMFSSRLDIYKEVKPIMEKISKQYGGNVHMTKLLGNEVVYIDNIEPSNSIIVKTRIGSRAPANCTSTGKAFLACLSDAKLESLFPENHLVKLTKNSISNITTLKKQLALIRERGYSIDNQESILGVKGVGAVCRSLSGKPIFGISLARLSEQFSADLVEEIGKLLKIETELLSKRLG